MPSKSVAVRVFSSKEDAENWQDHPINSFLPLFLGAEGTSITSISGSACYILKVLQL